MSYFQDDDPQCVCGVFLSEHSMLGCSDGFITPQDWEVEKQRIYDQVLMENDGSYYDPDGDGDCQDICEDDMGVYTDRDRGDCGCDDDGPDPLEDFGYFGYEGLHEE